MATKTPEQSALDGVEKAIKEYEKAREKADGIKEKYDVAEAAAKRANRNLTWTASHPDLPEDFDLLEFRKQLTEPFEADVPSVEADGDVSDTDETIGVDAIEAQQVEDPNGPIEPVAVVDLPADADDDDPFGDS